MELIFDKNYVEKLFGSLGFHIEWKGYREGTSVLLCTPRSEMK